MTSPNEHARSTRTVPSPCPGFAQANGALLLSPGQTPGNPPPPPRHPPPPPPPVHFPNSCQPLQTRAGHRSCGTSVTNQGLECCPPSEFSPLPLFLRHCMWPCSSFSKRDNSHRSDKSFCDIIWVVLSLCQCYKTFCMYMYLLLADDLESDTWSKFSLVPRYACSFRQLGTSCVFA